jgi:hypothetical protein
MQWLINSFVTMNM